MRPLNKAPEEILPPGMIDFRQADLNVVLQVYAELVNRTILRHASLPAPTITLKTQTPLTKKEAIQALDAVLAMNGISMVDIGDKFVKALAPAQAGGAGQEPSKLAADALPNLGAYVTHVVQLKYSKPSEIIPALQPFASGSPNPIVPIETSQILVLRDNAENVKRMLEMISQIDIIVPAEFTNEVISIKYALASDIASALNSLSTGGGGATVGSSSSGSRTGATSSSRMGGMGGSSGMNRTGGSTMGGSYPGSTKQGMGGASTMGTTTPGATGSSSSSFSDRLRNLISKASSSGDIQVLGQTKIIADERTNSLLIYASREDMKIIKDIIAKLDVVLAQVLIEAVVIEYTLDKSRSFGVSYLESKYHGAGNYYSGRGAMIPSGSSVLSSDSFGVVSNSATSLSSGFSYLAGFGNDLDVTLTALQGDSHAKILQRPRIQTSHAVAAHLFVGESRPYPTGSYYGGGSYGGYSSIQQMQIGVDLSVTPLINPDGLVVMEIQQNIDSVKGTVNIANVGDVPITSSKQASAKVAVRDRDTIMLGGLIENDKSDSQSGVPYLKDIPLLGALFRSSSTSSSRSELIVLIRPTVLPTPEVAALTATDEKHNMPGVRMTEHEFQSDNQKLLKATDKYLRHEDAKSQK